MSDAHVQLLLARHADTAWSQAIRPWLEVSHAAMTRNYVVVPTRGQAQGLKQRCVVEKVPLLGVEFLSPGLARQKWLPLVPGKPAIGRELLLFELRWLIARRIEGALPEADEIGVLKSLQSDAERALDDFDELLKAGFSSASFANPTLCAVFSELEERIERLGYSIGSTQSEKAALTPVGPDERPVGGRLLVYGLGAEAWGEFFNVAAFVRRFGEVTVILPEPEFHGRRQLDESWVEMWQTLLGTSPMPLAPENELKSCGNVAADWLGNTGMEADTSLAQARVLIGRTRAVEMELVADEVVRLLQRQTDQRNIAVVFPKADAAQVQLMRHLEKRAVPFINLLPGAGAAAQEVQLLQKLVEFYRQGGRMDEMLALWPLLRATGYATVSQGEARRVMESLFDERQVHALEPYVDSLQQRDRPEWKEVSRIVQWLMPAWPERSTLEQALALLEQRCEPLMLPLPANWAALREFARRETAEIPRQELCDLLLSFLPKTSSPSGTAHNSGFAPVTLTTRRRAEGLSWSHVIFVESNAGTWPMKFGISGWLTDEDRARLNAESRFSLGLFTSDDRAALEKRGYANLARDTRVEVLFTASLADEADPETALAPNGWLERVLWRTTGRGFDLQEACERLAVAGRPSEIDAKAVLPWKAVWDRRRDPLHPFDEYLFSVDPEKVKPQRLPARLLEAAVKDPAALWFDAVLGARRVPQGALLRSGRKVLGLQAHRILSAALRGENREGNFFARPDRAEAEARLAAVLGKVRLLWPPDQYWDSFHAQLEQICTVLLENLYALPLQELWATESWLPENLALEIDSGVEIGVSGRMDFLGADRDSWPGSVVDIIDFKTGADRISAKQMASNGTGLQLAVYLAAARKLGAAKGRVWMVKPSPGDAESLDMVELDPVLEPLKRIAASLRTGKYGALTAERSDYSMARVEWPLACAPVPGDVLRNKFHLTFGSVPEVEEGAGDE
jgi:hypothetical protein